jgi:hypothetical protein
LSYQLFFCAIASGSFLVHDFSRVSTSATLPPKAINRRSAVILTALDVETQAVLRHLELRGEKTIWTVFYQGDFEDWSIAVTECGAGNTSAAALAERELQIFGQT